jgi:hypothetical protein
LPFAAPRRRSQRHVAVARLDEAEEAVSQESERDCAKKQRPGCFAGELRERAVEPDRLVGVVLVGGPDQEDADEREHDRSGQVAEHADCGVPPVLAFTHAPRLQVVAEAAAESSVAVPETRAEDRETGGADEPDTER